MKSTTAGQIFARWCLVLALVLVPLTSLEAQSRKPLLQAGKSTLYQKVLTRPGTAPRATVNGTPGKTLPPMSLLYVYGQKDQDGQSWLEVGSNANGKIVGFVSAKEVVTWNHGMVLAFANPAQRQRVLFFKDQAGLSQILDDKAGGDQAKKLLNQADQNQLPGDSPIRSVEPKTFVDLTKQFYLFPVISAQNKLLPSGFKVRQVQVAAVTKKDQVVAQTTSGTGPIGQRMNPSSLKDFNNAVVFVIDASSSMQPYIDQTRKAVSQIYDQLEKDGLSGKVRFGLVAYQDDPKEVAGLSYLTKVFADPSKVADKAAFMQAVADLNAASVSTRAFSEDAYAGLDTAIKTIPWGQFGGRYVILVTDASAREGRSKLASTGLGTSEVRQLAQESGIALYGLHLLTNEGKNDHATAKAQFEKLTLYPGLGSLYFPVESGDVTVFGQQVDRLAQALSAQVKQSQKNPSAVTAVPSTKTDKLEQLTAEVGRAMQLAYLGRVQGEEAPTMFEAWASDRDLAQPDIEALSVRVLLSKNQLSDLENALAKLVDALETGQLNPSDFFAQVRSAAAAMSRDPAKIGQAKSLADTGLLGEYLDGLPYFSKLMVLDQEQFVQMSPGQQQALVDEINSKRTAYKRLHDDVGRWVRLDDSTEPGDTVYPVPLSLLP